MSRLDIRAGDRVAGPEWGTRAMAKREVASSVLDRSADEDAEGLVAARRLHAALCPVWGNDWRLVLWDGRSVGPDPARFVVTVRSREAPGRLLGALPEKAFGRAYVEGLLDIEPLQPFLGSVQGVSLADLLRVWPRIVKALVALGGRPRLTVVPAAEARLRGRRHSRERDAKAIRHHYDLPAEFYALWLDASMTYSCAYFESPDDDLDVAQRAKLDIVCRKLRLREGETMLDMGSGWGSLIIHAAEHYGVHAVGITLSPAQAEFTQRRIEELGLAGRVEARLADYRDPQGEFDAVASVGMVEHVGRRRLGTFSDAVAGALRPGGRALIHGITRPPHGLWNRASFIDKFVFPDGEIEDIGMMVRAYEKAGLEVRDVESLREHYQLTLNRWADRLDKRWDEAVGIVGPERARVWRLYTRGTAMGFGLAFLNIDQTLVVKPGDDGSSGMPLTRGDWYARSTT